MVKHIEKGPEFEIGQEVKISRRSMFYDHLCNLNQRLIVADIAKVGHASKFFATYYDEAFLEFHGYCDTIVLLRGENGKFVAWLASSIFVAVNGDARVEPENKTRGRSW
jgi:hypothetical protein